MVGLPRSAQSAECRLAGIRGSQNSSRRDRTSPRLNLWGVAPPQRSMLTGDRILISRTRHRHSKAFRKVIPVDGKIPRSESATGKSQSAPEQDPEQAPSSTIPFHSRIEGKVSGSNHGSVRLRSAPADCRASGPTTSSGSSRTTVESPIRRKGGYMKRTRQTRRV